jgi:AraC-like DNA-binding protein
MPISIPSSLTFEPCVVHQWIDPSGRFDPPLDRAFPFYIKLYSFKDGMDPCPPNWHERLEIFVPVAGDGQFRIGDRLVSFSPGEVLVVDNKKLHRTERIGGRQRCAIVITFLPEFVYTLGSPVCDVGYLSPFYCQVADVDPVVRAGNPRLPMLHDAINRLLRCYVDIDQDGARLGCKTYLLELLYHLAQHFTFAEVARSETLQQQQRARRLGGLLDHLALNYGKKISIADAAAMVGMSESRFMRYFRAAAGMTFVSYLTHIRLTHAARLLRESDLNISEVADTVGFRDQSYFDRQFRQGFSMTPREYRAAAPTATLPVSPASSSPSTIDPDLATAS